jgi:hypothetical protein
LFEVVALADEAEGRLEGDLLERSIRLTVGVIRQAQGVVHDPAPFVDGDGQPIGAAQESPGCNLDFHDVLAAPGAVVDHAVIGLGFGKHDGSPLPVELHFDDRRIPGVNAQQIQLQDEGPAGLVRQVEQHRKRMALRAGPVIHRGRMDGGPRVCRGVGSRPQDHLRGKRDGPRNVAGRRYQIQEVIVELPDLPEKSRFHGAGTSHRESRRRRSRLSGCRSELTQAQRRHHGDSDHVPRHLPASGATR